jgi:hypothetical protein
MSNRRRHIFNRRAGVMHSSVSANFPVSGRLERKPGSTGRVRSADRNHRTASNRLFARASPRTAGARSVSQRSSGTPRVGGTQERDVRRRPRPSRDDQEDLMTTRRPIPRCCRVHCRRTAELSRRAMPAAGTWTRPPERKSKSRRCVEVQLPERIGRESTRCTRLLVARLDCNAATRCGAAGIPATSHGLGRDLTGRPMTVQP